MSSLISFLIESYALLDKNCDSIVSKQQIANKHRYGNDIDVVNKLTAIDLVMNDDKFKKFAEKFIWAMIKEVYVRNDRVAWMIEKSVDPVPLPENFVRFVEASNLNKCEKFKRCLKSAYERQCLQFSKSSSTKSKLLSFLKSLRDPSKRVLLESIWDLNECLEDAIGIYPHSAYWLSKYK
ncbi:unknown [Spodoptera litura nucleopolyhedrovirus]|uniref:Uncharacterized protein n=1 Tax=Spodoptera litura multicapsid nucleopolyhedrovirus TaxID=46242 RepID=Q91BC6_NPVST|nr:hypothetical protein [Spodoptera litura nucleopolyhedrovirus]WML75167.1 hypothetical protein KBIHDJOI_00125 [Spodoptera littoralis nucleopolyhedrovirus]AAL01785.1 unknown [Spodoptera litura nucleopolyhedrovirus]QHN73952.1 hypothetical protein [Spodoptera litura nucleopolyhedrovirus]UQV25638.1 hypothetical protein [Spodoptera litura nucleopolyhedrovirus]WOC30961.1 hypothetical protein GACBDANE_00032 [Spodoptera litura nucleopolyhedrovirus]